MGIEYKAQAYHKQQINNALEWFKEQMKDKLYKNIHKGSWRGCEMQYLSMRITQEKKELSEAFKSGDKKKIIQECADIANFAMMIADNIKNN